MRHTIPALELSFATIAHTLMMGHSPAISEGVNMESDQHLGPDDMDLDKENERRCGKAKAIIMNSSSVSNAVDQTEHKPSAMSYNAR